MNQANKLLLQFIAFFFSMFFAGYAAAIPPDFTTLTAAVDYSTAIAAILLVFAALAGVYIVTSGGSMILSKVRGR